MFLKISATLKKIFRKHENGVMLESTVAHIKKLTYVYDICIHIYLRVCVTRSHQQTK